MSDILILDFETAASEPSGPLKSDIMPLSFAAIATSFEDILRYEDEDRLIADLREKSFYCTFQSKELLEAGFKTQESTIAFWREQNISGIEYLKASDKYPRYVINEFCKQFSLYCCKNKINDDTTILIRAPHFDFPIILNLFKCAGLHLPFSHWNVRDIRTFIDGFFILTSDDKSFKKREGYIPNFKKSIAPKLLKHYAVDDCIMDLIQLRQIYG